MNTALIDLVAKIEDALSAHLSDTTGPLVEFPYVYKALNEEYTFDQLIIGYENFRQKKMASEFQSVLRNQLEPNKGFL